MKRILSLLIILLTLSPLVPAGVLAKATVSHSIEIKQKKAPSKKMLTATVTIADYMFSPALLTIKKGTTVTWTNQDLAKHTVTGDASGPKSGFFAKGEKYSYTFKTVGTFSYHCQPHPYMTAKIVVTP